MVKYDPTFLALRDLQIPVDALQTSSLKAKEGLVADWVEGKGWVAGRDGLPKGLCMIGGHEKDLAWALLIKELSLVGEQVTRTTMAELTMHARWNDTTPHKVVGSLLSKGRYAVEDEESESVFEEYNTLPQPFHIFIDDFGIQVTKDMLNRAWARDTILLLAYYCSVYIRGESMDKLKEIHGDEYMRKLTGGNFASIGVLE
jgi:hypothetical protein